MEKIQIQWKYIYWSKKVRDQTFKDAFFSRLIINQVLNYMVD